MSDLMKRESKFRSPLASALADGEKWMVGFDDMFNRLVEKWEDGFDGFHEYPASNIKRVADDHYRIEVAVAGFNRDDLKIELEDETLIVKGNQEDEHWLTDDGNNLSAQSFPTFTWYQVLAVGYQA